MTGANRSPTQQTTRGLRCQTVPTPAQAGRQGLQAAVLGAGFGLSPSIPVRSKRLELVFSGVGVTFGLGKLGGGAGRRSNGACRVNDAWRSCVCREQSWSGLLFLLPQPELGTLSGDQGRVRRLAVSLIPTQAYRWSRGCVQTICKRGDRRCGPGSLIAWCSPR